MKFLKRGNEVDFVETAELSVTDSLPTGTYLLKSAEMRGFYLEKVADFGDAGRIYGDAMYVADMIYNGFTSRSVSTGALLHGYKGTGKTSLVKLIAQKASADEKSVIMINEPFRGSDFNSLFDKLPDSVVVFDEFEKVYKQQEQESLLTIFDGTTSTKCLFLLTANNYNSVNTHLINRPGRLLYSIEFSGLTKAVIDEYLEVNLVHAIHAADIRKVFSVFSGTTFDMMKGVVDEVNRTNRPATELLPYLNIDISGDRYTQYSAIIEREGKLFDNHVMVDQNPLGKNTVNVFFDSDSDESSTYTDFNLSIADFIEIKGTNLLYAKDGYNITFVPIPTRAFNFNAV